MPQPATQSDSHSFHPSILREYDIRGIVGETLHANDAFAIGQVFASIVRDRTGQATPHISVARDGRLSSPELAQSLSDGLQAAGAHVIDIGVGPTPMLYFAVYHLEAAAGIMVTGSHNPPTHNGFKMMLGQQSFFGDQIRGLGERAANGQWIDGNGSKENKDITTAYIDALLGGMEDEGRVLKATWDSGNGATGDIVESLCELAENAQEQIRLFTKIDGTFPNHHPDPSQPKNMEQLIKVVTENGCDIGLAFDGDGDRLGVVDDRGRVVNSDHLLMLFARDVLQHKKGLIIADVKTSKTFFDDVQSFGGDPLMWKTGHSHIKTKMKEEGAQFAGEASGHIFFADRYFGFDDGLYAAIRILNILAHSDIPLSDMVDSLPTQCSTPEIRIDCAETRKFAVIEEVHKRLEEENADFASIDGVRVNTPDGWWLLRASNTQAAIIARCESTDKEGLKKLTDMLRSQLEASGVFLPL